MRNRGKRHFHPAQDASAPQPHHGPRPPRANHGRRPPHPARPARGEIIFGVEPVRELLVASPNAIQTLYVKAGSYERFGGEIEAVREAGGRVVKAEDAEL